MRNMNSAYNELKWGLNYKLLKQGMKPKMQLINDFKNDGNAVLFATKSFFTGVDIPGEALRCVVIDKFPFPSPADPIMQKLSQDPNSFFKYFIPIMVITLKQAVGRGVRSITDKCVIAVLDGRMSTARYKSRINNSFPYQKTGTRDLEEVRRFLGTGMEFDTGEGNEDDIPF
jgi:ATP-dependent DNA helicase DinG